MNEGIEATIDVRGVAGLQDIPAERRDALELVILKHQEATLRNWLGQVLHRIAKIQTGQKSES